MPLPSQEKPWLALYEDTYQPIADSTAYQCLRCNRPYNPQAIALRYFNASLSYGQLFERIDDYARAFVALGVTAGDVVAVALPTSPEHVLSFYALNRIGAIANLIDLRSRGKDLESCLAEAPIKAVLVFDASAKDFAAAAQKLGVKHLIVVSPMASLPTFTRFIRGKGSRAGKSTGTSLKRFLAQGKGVELPSSPVGRADDVAVILHSSGTTGKPKSICISNGAMNAMVANFCYVADYAKPEDIFMNHIPPFLAYNIIVATHLPLCARVILQLLPVPKAAVFASNVSKIKPNYVVGGPADWCNFLEQPPACKDFSFLRFAASGSDSMNQKSLQEVNEFLAQRGCTTQISEGYGMTEIGAAALFNPPGKEKMGTLGIPLVGNSICIIDEETQQELPCNQSGEVCLTGPTLMTGYYHDPQATAEILKVHEDGLTWLHTGDLGWLDEEGYLHFEGRIKRVIIRNVGFKVPSYNVEQVVAAEPGIESCCVVGFPDTEHGCGEVPVAFVVLEEGADKEQVLKGAQARCEAELSHYYWPVEYRVLKSMPLTPNGKVDYRSLQANKQAEE